MREANGGRTLEIKWVVVEAQKERIILHSPNGHLNKQIGEETTLHSIKTTFVVSELLMMYKGSFAPLSMQDTASFVFLIILRKTPTAFIPGDTLAGSN